ncbi:MAG TPA: redox-sensing transcriptional repressor Rex [Spirochaetota bacterium]|nr:redox-sensing transcriptional repressor Rex [Spirochaetota bacterium]HRZ26036.1 redox-sensing transcriptional repressor Rex [Spirochaetota bacterium]HSA14846.1 redox-sensing transcriptional repressor Rex [Spirochaetota bacterium]
MPAIPKPTISRLCKIYSLLEELEDKGQLKLSSNEIGRRLGVGSHNIRKDLTYLGETGTTGSGYEIKKLKDQIAESLGFTRKRKACIVGLGKMGTAILSNEMFFSKNFDIIAGFDTNINRLETLKIDIPLYPTYDIPVVVKREKIELALLTLPGETAQNIAEKLIEGGIKGIVNFSPVVLSSPDDKVYITNIDIIDEFRFLSALFTLEKKEADNAG